jgi:hypothetical protein
MENSPITHQGRCGTSLHPLSHGLWVWGIRRSLQWLCVSIPCGAIFMFLSGGFKGRENGSTGMLVNRKYSQKSSTTCAALWCHYAHCNEDSASIATPPLQWVCGSLCSTGARVHHCSPVHLWGFVCVVMGSWVCSLDCMLLLMWLCMGSCSWVKNLARTINKVLVMCLNSGQKEQQYCSFCPFVAMEKEELTLYDHTPTAVGVWSYSLHHLGSCSCCCKVNTGNCWNPKGTQVLAWQTRYEHIMWKSIEIY